jgi:hypothetical protein
VATTRARWVSLVAVLLLHAFGLLTWIFSLAFAADIGTQRQFYAACAFGFVTWLAAAAVIVWFWRRRTATIPIPFLWWMPSYLAMIALVYGWD